MRYRVLYTAVTLLYLILILIAYSYTLKIGAKSVFYSDFGRFYQSLQFHHAGQSYYTKFYVLQRATADHPVLWNYTPNLNPPIFNLLLTPLGYLDFTSAFIVWSVVSMLAASFSILLLAKILKLKLTPVYYSLGWVAAFLIYYPVYRDIEYAQVSLLLLPILIIAWRCARTQQQGWAGLLMGVLTAVKPFFGLYLCYFFWRREWLGLVAWWLSFILCWLVGLYAVGWSGYLDYYHAFDQVAWYGASLNASLLGFLVRLLGASNGLTIPLYYSIALGCIVLLRRNLLTLLPNIKLKVDLDFSCVSVMMLFLSPFGWIYYFPLLIIAFGILLVNASQLRYPTWIFMLTLLALLSSNLPGSSDIFQYGGWGFYSLPLLLIAITLAYRGRGTEAQVEFTPGTLRMLAVIILAPAIFNITLMTLGMMQKPDNYIPQIENKIYLE